MKYFILMVAAAVVSGCDQDFSRPAAEATDEPEIESVRPTKPKVERRPKTAAYRARLRQLHQEIADENIAAGYRRNVEWTEEHLEDTKRHNEDSILYKGGRDIKHEIWAAEDEWARRGVQEQLRVIRERRVPRTKSKSN